MNNDILVGMGFSHVFLSSYPCPYTHWLSSKFHENVQANHGFWANAIPSWSQALPTPWWLLLNETSTSTSTTMVRILKQKSQLKRMGLGQFGCFYRCEKWDFWRSGWVVMFRIYHRKWDSSWISLPRTCLFESALLWQKMCWRSTWFSHGLNHLLGIISTKLKTWRYSENTLILMACIPYLNVYNICFHKSCVPPKLNMSFLRKKISPLSPTGPRPASRQPVVSSQASFGPRKWRCHGNVVGRNVWEDSPRRKYDKV